MTSIRSPRSWLAIAAAVGLMGCAYALVAQKPGCAEQSHLALVRALHAGTPAVDGREIEFCDVSFWHGQYYSNKAPGLAALALPVYSALNALDAAPGDVLQLIWSLNLWAVIIPTLVLLVLVARAAEWVEPGSGPLAAVTLGAGTLVLPFATLFFSHVPAATLGFAAFMLLWHDRRGPPRTALVLAAGLLVGLAETIEYPMAIFAIVLGIYAIARGPRLRRALAFTVGTTAGIAPLLLYNQWAFGAFGHLSYRAVVSVPGKTGHDVLGAHADGFFGISAPSFHALVSFFVEERGMLVLTPVVATGAAGLWLLRRSRWRTEAYVGLALCTLFVVYNAGFDPPNGGPFGGSTPGPRFLIAILPFVAFPIGVAYRRAPATVIVLLLISIANMASATATEPFLNPGQSIPWRWEIRTGRFQETVLTWLGAGSWAAMLPFFAAVVLAASIGVVSARSVARPKPADLAVGLVGLAAWLVIVLVARPAHAAGDDVEALAVVVAGVTLVILAARRMRRGGTDQPPSGGTVAPASIRATSASSNASR